MKRLFLLVLAVALLLPAAACAYEDEYIGGEGWWDYDYPGEWHYCADAGLFFKLPYDWGDDFGDEQEMLFCRNDYCITLAVEMIDANVYAIERQVNDNGGWWDGDYYDECAGIILYEDRDWTILANAYSMVAITYGEYGGSVVFRFGFEEDDYYRQIVRRIISSVETGQ